MLSHIGRRTSEGKELLSALHPSPSAFSNPPLSARSPHISLFLSLSLHHVSSDFQLKLFRPTLCLFPSFPRAQPGSPLHFSRFSSDARRKRERGSREGFSFALGSFDDENFLTRRNATMSRGLDASIKRDARLGSFLKNENAKISDDYWQTSVPPRSQS